MKYRTLIFPPQVSDELLRSVAASKPEWNQYIPPCPESAEVTEEFAFEVLKQAKVPLYFEGGIVHFRRHYSTEKEIPFEDVYFLYGEDAIAELYNRGEIKIEIPKYFKKTGRLVDPEDYPDFPGYA